MTAKREEVSVLDRLAAIEDIKLLKARYFRLIDTQNWDNLRALFTDDAVLDFPESMNAPCLIDTFMPALSAMLRGVTSVHHGHMPEILITAADEASAIWAMDDMLFLPSRAPEQGDAWAGAAFIRGYGHYHETYRREGGKWLIRTLRLSRLRLEKTLAPQTLL